MELEIDIKSNSRKGPLRGPVREAASRQDCHMFCAKSRCPTFSFFPFALHCHHPSMICPTVFRCNRQVIRIRKPYELTKIGYVLDYTCSRVCLPLLVGFFGKVFFYFVFLHLVTLDFLKILEFFLMEPFPVSKLGLT